MNSYPQPHSLSINHEAAGSQTSRSRFSAGVRGPSPSFYPRHDVGVFDKDDPIPPAPRVSAPSDWWSRSGRMDGPVECIRSSCSTDNMTAAHGGRIPSVEVKHYPSKELERPSDAGINIPWFHRNISRETTERYLNNKANGTFLVRDSTNFPGDYTLSMTYKGKVEHYRIYQVGGQLTCDNEEFFSNLTQLVSHYKRDADGLCHRLVTPIICESFRLPAIRDDTIDKSAIFRQAGLIISPSDIQLGDIIGHGEFGDVLLGVYREQKVAVKVSKRNQSGAVMADCLLDEARFIIGLKHRNLVTLVGVVADEGTVYMVTEYMANGNLVDLLRSRGRHQLEKNQLLQFAVDICCGMCYLEQRQIVHRDLAARNILLDDQLVAKVSDFGLAKRADSLSLDSSSGKFPIKWTAPEALRHSNFTTKSDVWSFAILLWEIYSFGRVPYPRIPIQDVVRHIERGYRMEAPEGCPQEISRIMSEAWALNPEERPSFSQMLTKLQSVI